jgi:hypothetical protein
VVQEIEPTGNAFAVEPLPVELSGLKRPKANHPANPAGCFTVVFGIIWILISTAFTVIGSGFLIQEQQEYDLLMREGQTVQGMVTTLAINEGDDSTDYDVYYRYPVTANDRQRAYNGYQNISKDLYETLRVGQTVDVVYAASQPQVSKLKDDLSPPLVWVFFLVILFGVGFDAFGLFLLARTLASMREWSRLKRKGHTVQATVFERWTESDSDGDTIYAVAYAFKAAMPDGSVRLVTRGEYNRVVYHSVEMGGSLAVRYLPDEPEVSRIV